jgi:hypothetical protein
MGAAVVMERDKQGTQLYISSVLQLVKQVSESTLLATLVATLRQQCMYNMRST